MFLAKKTTIQTTLLTLSSSLLYRKMETRNTRIQSRKMHYTYTSFTWNHIFTRNSGNNSWYTHCLDTLPGFSRQWNLPIFSFPQLFPKLSDLFFIFHNLVLHFGIIACVLWEIMLSTYYLFFIPLIKTEFRFKSRKYTTRAWLRKLKKLVGEYTKILVLHRNINTLIGPMIAALHTLVAQVALFSNFTLISRWNKLSLTVKMILGTWTCANLLSWCIMLTLGELMLYTSEKLLHSWKHYGGSKREKVWIYKYQRACQPLAFRFGTYFSIKPFTILEFLIGIFNRTLRASLALDSDIF